MTRILGNTDNLPWHRRYLEDLGVLPVRARIYRIEDEDPWIGDDGEEIPYPWQLDGYAVVDGQFAVTSTCWNFPTWESAVQELPDFEAAVREATD